MPPQGDGRHFMVLTCVVMVGIKELFDVSFWHVKRRKKTMIINLLNGLSLWIVRCLRRSPKKKAVMNDSLALFFILVGDDKMRDKRERSLVFFIFLLEFHALILTITGTTDFDLYGMVKDTVQDRPGGDRVTQVFGPGFFFHVGCKY